MNREYYEKKKLDLSNRHDSNGKKCKVRVS